MPSRSDDLVLTFESVNFTMQAESIFEDNGLKLKIIPTPREISSSCGLSILTDMDLLDNIKKLEEDGMRVAAYWEFFEDEEGKKQAVEIREE